MAIEKRASWLTCLVVAIAAIVFTSPVARAQDDPETIKKELEAERAQLAEQMRQLDAQTAALKERAQRIEELISRLDAALANEVVPAATKVEAEVQPSEPMEPEHIETGPNETRDPHEPMTGEALTSEAFKGSWPLFGTDYRMKIGGYFKLDALYDIDGSGDKYQFLISQIPVEGTPEDARSGFFSMFVRETRFGMDIRNSSKNAPAQQFFAEVDFFDERSTSPRLRHMYLVYDHLLVGHTWTTIAELASLVYVIDFGGGDALFGTRAPQIRWEQNASPTWSWAVGLEELQSSGIYNPDQLQGRASPQLPVFAARLTHQRADGVRTLAGMVQQLRWDTEGVASNPTATGWALVFGGRQNLPNKDFFTWNVAYGDGTPETIMALTGSDANAVLTGDYHLITRKGYSVALGFGHKWNDTLSTNLAYAWADLEDIGQRAPDAIQTGGVGHINLIWAPREKLSTGFEFMWGTRDNASGADGSATRLQTMVKYTF